MQTSYVNRISKVIMKMVTILMIGLGVATIGITAVYGVRLNKERMQSNVLRYSGLVNEQFTQTISQLESLVVMMENRQLSGQAATLSYVDTIVASGECLSAAYVAYDNGYLIMSGGWEAPEGFDHRTRPWYVGAKEAEEFYLRALSIYERLAISNSDMYEPHLATVFHIFILRFYKSYNC